MSAIARCRTSARPAGAIRGAVIPTPSAAPHTLPALRPSLADAAVRVCTPRRGHYASTHVSSSPPSVSRVSRRFFTSGPAAPDAAAALTALPYDLVVIGGGLVGLACARAMQLRHRDKRVLVVEAESRLAAHQSTRNSGVLHAGIYYAPGSIRAELCREGAERMYAYCDEHGIPTSRVGKLIVATDESEFGGLETLYHRGLSNGCRDLQMIDSHEGIRRLEPNVSGRRALLSPHTGVVDFGRVAASYARDLTLAGGEIRLDYRVAKVRSESQGGRQTYEIISARADRLFARNVITCAGVYSDRVSLLFGGTQEPVVIPVRGSWLQLKPEFARTLVRRNIYPVPNPAFPFLGVHFTPTLGGGADGSEVGGMLVGPNALLATSRQGYSLTDFTLADFMPLLHDSGLLSLVRRHWRFGLGQLMEELMPHLALRACQAYVPSLRWEHLQVARPVSWLAYERPVLQSGVRAQAISPDGQLIEDFVIQEQASLTDLDPLSPDARKDRRAPLKHASIIHVRNAPSPAATSSLAIAERVANRAEKAFRW